MLGSAAFHKTCALCHGRDAISTNTIPDLRRMTPDTRKEFKDIVLKGTRSPRACRTSRTW